MSDESIRSRVFRVLALAAIAVATFVAVVVLMELATDLLHR